MMVEFVIIFCKVAGIAAVLGIGAILLGVATGLIKV
jgi:hypothetical protein